MVEVPRFYRVWFFAAAIYNALWAVVVIALPEACIDLVGVKGMLAVPFMQVIGMMVGVYAYGYWLLAKDPIRYCGLIWVGLFGKLLGIAGLLYYAARGVLPWSFGWTVLPNDVIWIPVFTSFAWRFARKPV